MRPICRICLSRALSNFNPRTPCGVRLQSAVLSITAIRFQSTHPVRGATILPPNTSQRFNISIHAPRAGCDLEILRDNTSGLDISIHAPRAGCDRRRLRHKSGRGFISIHAPRAGCDKLLLCSPIAARIFQSTHPVRGATRGLGCADAKGENFNPRTPCGVRQARLALRVRMAYFNPRTPCGVRRRARGH